jgi:hypothetical protein
MQYLPVSNVDEVNNIASQHEIEVARKKQTVERRGRRVKYFAYILLALSVFGTYRGASKLMSANDKKPWHDGPTPAWNHDSSNKSQDSPRTQEESEHLTDWGRNDYKTYKYGRNMHAKGWAGERPDFKSGHTKMVKFDVTASVLVFAACVIVLRFVKTGGKHKLLKLPMALCVAACVLTVFQIKHIQERKAFWSEVNHGQPMFNPSTAPKTPDQIPI